MLTGMYRGVTGTAVQVREVWGQPDAFDAVWLDRGRIQRERLSRRELEAMLVAGLLKREV